MTRYTDDPKYFEFRTLTTLFLHPLRCRYTDDPKYFEFRTSGIEVDIQPDQPNDFRIELERAK